MGRGVEAEVERAELAVGQRLPEEGFVEGFGRLEKQIRSEAEEVGFRIRPPHDSQEGQEAIGRKGRKFLGPEVLCS